MDRPGARLAIWVGLALMAIATARLALVSQIGLGDDEAYYWTWSQQLDWSYFDHPGGLAWLISASTRLFGHTPLAVRLPVVVSSVAVSAVLGWMGRARGARGVWLGAMLGALLPALGLMGVFSAPDLPMLAAWLAAVCLAEGLGSDTTGRWALAGAMVGATMLFKITGGLLAVGLVGWTLSDSLRRSWWRGLGPWLAVLVALVVSSPTWVWNLAHDLPTLRFHAVGRHTHAPSLWQAVGVWLGAHLVLLLPTVAWAICRSSEGARRSLLIWSAAPTWILFTVAAFLTSAKAHWWAPAWVSLLPVAVDWLAQRPRHARRVLLLCAGLHAGVLLLARFTPGPLLPATAELRGWSSLVDELRGTPARAWVTPRYQASAQLEWAARDRETPPVVRVSGRADQYTIWGRDQLPAEGPILLICPSHLPCRPDDIPSLSCAGEHRRPVTRAGGRVVRSFDVWTCQPSS